MRLCCINRRPLRNQRQHSSRVTLRRPGWRPWPAATENAEERLVLDGSQPYRHAPSYDFWNRGCSCSNIECATVTDRTGGRRTSVRRLNRWSALMERATGIEPA